MADSQLILELMFYRYEVAVLLRPISTSFGFRISDANPLFSFRIRMFANRSERSHPNLMHSDVLFFIRNRLANLKFPDSNSQSKCCISKLEGG